MKPPPPMLPASGSTTSSANATATAASIALPPCFRMSTPTCDASGCAETTIAWGAVTGRARRVQVAGMTAGLRIGVGPAVAGAGGRCAQPRAASRHIAGSFRIRNLIVLFSSMTNRDFHDPRATEQRNPRSERIDVASSIEIVDIMNGEDARVAGVGHGQREGNAHAIGPVVAAIQAGGAPVYVCAGPSGRA